MILIFWLIVIAIFLGFCSVVAFLVEDIRLEKLKQKHKERKESEDMAYHCKKGSGECIGCGRCEEPVRVMVDDFGTEIYAGEMYYDFETDIVAEDNLNEWLKGHRKIAGKDCE